MSDWQKNPLNLSMGFKAVLRPDGESASFPDAAQASTAKPGTSFVLVDTAPAAGPQVESTHSGDIWKRSAKAWMRQEKQKPAADPDEKNGEERILERRIEDDAPRVSRDAWRRSGHEFGGRERELGGPELNIWQKKLREKEERDRLEAERLREQLNRDNNLSMEQQQRLLELEAIMEQARQRSRDRSRDRGRDYGVWER